MRVTLMITSSPYGNSRQVTIQIPLSCLGESSEKGYYRQWFAADNAKNAVFSSVADGEKAKRIKAEIDVACAASAWNSVMHDVELTLDELRALGFDELANLADRRG